MKMKKINCHKQIQDVHHNLLWDLHVKITVNSFHVVFINTIDISSLNN